MLVRPHSDEFASESSYTLLDIFLRQEHTGTDLESSQGSRPASPLTYDQDLDGRCNGSTTLSVSGKAKTHELSFYKRIGWYLLLCNIGSMIPLFGAVSALSFLWFGDNSSKTWTQLMVDGWVGQAVTLCTLAIRLAVATQASTAVTMLAAIALESKRCGGVFLADAAAISLARYVNTGPLASIPTFWNYLTWFNFGILPLMVLLAICTLVSQFTSTLLLWDVRTGVVQGFPREITLATGIGMQSYIKGFSNTLSKAQNYWTPSPQTFPTFAEWNKKPDVQVSSIADTGPTIRAFLPMNSQADRSIITKYEGIAGAFDARVVCIRPILEDWEFSSRSSSVRGVPSRGFFRGYVRPTNLIDEIKEILRYNHSKLGIPFNCLYDNMDFTSDSMFKICTVSDSNGGLINSLDHTSNGSMDQYFGGEVALNSGDLKVFDSTWMAPDNQSSLKWPVEMGRTFLLLEIKGGGTENDYWGFDALNFTVNDQDVWLHLSTDIESRITVEVRVTICYDAQ